MIRKTRTGEYEYYDIAPKTTDGRTLDGHLSLVRARELAAALLISRGACTIEAASILNYTDRRINQQFASVCEEAGFDGKFPKSGKPLDDIRDECIKIMHSCDYTVLDLSEIWDLSINRISSIVGED